MAAGSDQEDGGKENAKQRYETSLARANSLILRYGVIISCGLILAGIIDAFLNSAKESLPLTVSQLIASNVQKPSLNPAILLSGLLSLNGIYMIEVGLLLLLATPILRVSVTIIFFAAEKDRAYVVIGLFVLLVLLFSVFVVGPFEGAQKS